MWCSARQRREPGHRPQLSRPVDPSCPRRRSCRAKRAFRGRGHPSPARGYLDEVRWRQMRSSTRWIPGLIAALAVSERAWAAEACGDGLDNDADGLVDCADPDCPFPDQDGDAWCDDSDDCPLVADPLQSDADGDGTGDACDAC